MCLTSNRCDPWYSIRRWYVPCMMCLLYDASLVQCVPCTKPPLYNESLVWSAPCTMSPGPMCHFYDLSQVCVPHMIHPLYCTMHPLYDVYLVRCAPCTMRPLDAVSLGWCVPWICPLNDVSLGWCVPYDKASLRQCVPSGTDVLFFSSFAHIVPDIQGHFLWFLSNHFYTVILFYTAQMAGNLSC
jgi:hypothetical protein